MHRNSPFTEHSLEQVLIDGSNQEKTPNILEKVMVIDLKCFPSVADYYIICKKSDIIFLIEMSFVYRCPCCSCSCLRRSLLHNLTIVQMVLHLVIYKFVIASNAQLMKESPCYTKAAHHQFVLGRLHFRRTGSNYWRVLSNGLSQSQP